MGLAWTEMSENNFGFTTTRADGGLSFKINRLSWITDLIN